LISANDTLAQAINRGGILRHIQSVMTTGLLTVAITLGLLPGCSEDQSELRGANSLLFIGVDTSGSFGNSGHYDNALSFLAHYIYGHLNELGGLEQPEAMFVTSVGGKSSHEPKRFHPIHELEGKDVTQIEELLKEWFPSTDVKTDFTPFFKEVVRMTKEQSLVPKPVSIMIITDGTLDSSVRELRTDEKKLYEYIDLKPLEYLSRNVTLRLAYISPKIGAHWRAHVPRHHVRLWTVDADVMKGWHSQIRTGIPMEEQNKLWYWLRDNVDYRVRANVSS